jgi:uncharacterized protein (DUF427 family)
VSRRLREARAKWLHVGGVRPDFAIEPASWQESVWDYPRPPRLAQDRREVVVCAGTLELARTHSSIRVLETASPPTFYLPPNDVRTRWLRPTPGASQCEWKGEAVYWRLESDGDAAPPVAWSVPDPYPEFASIRNWFGFYPSRLDCRVDGVRVAPQPGTFYAGWVTPELVGPFKGEAGTEHW